MGRPVREHRCARDVSYGEDMRHVGVHLSIDRDDAALVDRDPRGRGIDGVAVGAAPDRDKHTIEILGRRHVRPLESRSQAARVRLELGDARAQHNARIALLDALLQRTDKISVGSRHQSVGELDHRDSRAECVVHACHLEPDDAAAHHQKPLAVLG
jgi:hypothetical protein